MRFEQGNAHSSRRTRSRGAKQRADISCKLRRWGCCPVLFRLSNNGGEMFRNHSGQWAVAMDDSKSYTERCVIKLMVKSALFHSQRGSGNCYITMHYRPV